MFHDLPTWNKCIKNIKQRNPISKGFFFFFFSIPILLKIETKHKRIKKNENEESTWPTVRRVQDWNELRLEFAPKTSTNQTRLLKTTTIIFRKKSLKRRRRRRWRICLYLKREKGLWCFPMLLSQACCRCRRLIAMLVLESKTKEKKSEHKIIFGLNIQTVL